jgi:hypothetical protein
MAKNQVTLTFAGDSKNLEKSFDNVGAGAKKMGDSASEQASKIDRLGEAGGNTETRFLGLGAGISGVSTLLSGDLNAETAAMAMADLGDAVEHTLAPLLSQGKALIASGVAAVQAGAHSMAAGIKMAAAWVIGLGPIALVVAAIAGIIAILVALGVDLEDVKRIAGKAWGFIQNAAAGAFNWIKRNWPLLLAILTGPIGLAVLAIGKHKDKILGFFRGIPGAIRGFFSGLGNAISGPFEAAVRAIKRVWNAGPGGFGFTVPSWIPGVGGKGFRIPSMHTGGIVPGAPGTETLALLQAGERVSSASASGGGPVVHVHVAGSILSERDVQKIVRDAIDRGGLRR